MALSFPATATSVAGTSVTLPAHAVGDLLVIFAYEDGSATQPTKPAAAGTVPAWSDINAGAGANTNSSRSAFFVATATNHTSGTWTGATGMVAVVIRGQNTSPIGASAVGGSTANGSAVAPAITPQSTDGSSFFLHFVGHRTVTAWSAAPSGYTTRTSVATEVCFDTKNITTTDGAVTQAATTTNSGYRGESIEILNLPLLDAAKSTVVTAPSAVESRDCLDSAQATLIAVPKDADIQTDVDSAKSVLVGLASAIESRDRVDAGTATLISSVSATESYVPGPTGNTYTDAGAVTLANAVSAVESKQSVDAATSSVHAVASTIDTRGAVDAGKATLTSSPRAVENKISVDVGASTSVVLVSAIESKTSVDAGTAHVSASVRGSDSFVAAASPRRAVVYWAQLDIPESSGATPTHVDAGTVFMSASIRASDTATFVDTQKVSAVSSSSASDQEASMTAAKATGIAQPSATENAHFVDSGRITVTGEVSASKATADATAVLAHLFPGATESARFVDAGSILLTSAPSATGGAIYRDAAKAFVHAVVKTALEEPHTRLGYAKTREYAAYSLAMALDEFIFDTAIPHDSVADGRTSESDVASDDHAWAHEQATVRRAVVRDSTTF